MLPKEEIDVKAKTLLTLGEKPRDIVDQLDITYNRVLLLKREMRAEAEKNKVNEAATVDPVALELVVEKAREQKAPARVIKKLEDVQEGLSGLQMLDANFHKTMGLALTKAEDFLKDKELKVSEWVAVTNALSNAYNNIFNNKGVNVHVDNSTQVSNTKLAMFKGSMRE